MARERAKDFDAEDFIESVRQSAVPTYHTAADSAKLKPPADSEEPAKHPPSVTKTRKPKVSVNDLDFDEDDEMEKFSHLTLNDEELEFIKAFIVKKSFRQISHRGKQVIIRDSHRKRIKTIQQLLGEEPNMATYIDNVLDVHFKQFYPEIMGIYKKCPPKF